LADAAFGLDQLARELAVDEGAFGLRLEGRDLVVMLHAARWTRWS
jgi:hypothetical protein